MFLKKITQFFLDKILIIFPFNINYSLSFKDKTFFKLLNNDFNFINDTDLKPTILLLQGPIINYKYLYTSIKYYSTSKSFHKIIISTWENDFTITQKKELEVLGVIDIIENKKPKYFGISNINLQIVSTLNGLNYIKKYFPDCYVLKSRTDQRLINPTLNIFLKSLLSTYPISNPILNKRIIVCSYNTFKFRIYSISDMFMFGEISDLLLYWSVSLDERIISLEEIQKPRTMKSWSKLTLAEVYLSTNFFKKIGQNYNWTICDYWESLSNLFIVVDSDAIGFEWRKYTFNNKNGTLNQFNLREKFYNFSDWLVNQNKKIEFDFEKIENKINFHENIKIQKN